MNHIELFAGCGGLSLGLEAAGFELLLANELSPMAAESFSYNLLQENLALLAEEHSKPKNVLWIKSKFSGLKDRLRENPLEYPQHSDEGYSDWPSSPNTLKGKLIVGSILELNRLLESDNNALDLVRNGFDSNGGLDLVSGGPPCQSFSMAGLRERHSDKNTLPWEFAKFVKLTRPKVALLENVTGILRAFSDEDGNKFHAWYEVAKAFALIGYVPLCLHINAKFSGVPQNRPRFIMLAFRYDYIRSNLLSSLNDKQTERLLFDKSLKFYELVKDKGESLEFGHLDYFDVQKEEHKSLFEGSFLSPLISNSIVSVKDALDDLKSNPTEPSSFIKELNNLFADITPLSKDIKNHELRKHDVLVQRRFRIYQVLQLCGSKSITKEVITILKNESKTLSEDAWDKLKKHKFLLENKRLELFSTKWDLEQYLLRHPTKKQTQKALNPINPAPAALSIPDDACHYDESELRVLTVREMARIQSFPDSFVFRSKVTTGGQMRKFEVPQYTQVGNAVPPLLGFALGKVLKSVIDI